MQAKGAFRVLLRIMGVDMTRSADLLSMIHFEPDYLRDVLEIGYEDAYRRRDELEDFLGANHIARADRAKSEPYYPAQRKAGSS